MFAETASKASDRRSVIVGRWRHEVLSCLRERDARQWEPFRKYELAIERVSLHQKLFSFDGRNKFFQLFHWLRSETLSCVV